MTGINSNGKSFFEETKTSVIKKRKSMRKIAERMEFFKMNGEAGYSEGNIAPLLFL